MRRLSYIVTVIIAVAANLAAAAQQFEWSVDFNTVFDNREGDKEITPTRTFFHTQLAPEIGVSLLDGTHRVMGGVVWTQPIGTEWHEKRLSPTIYYLYSGPKGWNIALGMFPRTLLRRNLPEYIWSDSVYYSQHNLRGFMASYQGKNGFFEAIVDWRSMQTAKQREAFNIFAQGEWKRSESVFLAGGVAMMNHLALSRNAPADQHIVDNFIVNPYVGLDFSHKTALDSLAFRVGPLSSITRNRADRKWRLPVGVRLDILLSYKWFEWHNITYAGGRIFPYYSQFQSLLDQGEPYYSTRFYNRTSVAGTLFDNRFVNLRASLDFNLAPHNFTFYQRIILRVYIDSSFKKLPKNYRLKATF